MSSIAVAAAVRVAAGYGYSTGVPPLVLQESNNTVVWLRPFEVVAKVGTSRQGADDLEREHAVAQSLAADGAPIAPPLAGTEPVHDRDTGLVVTLWTWLAHDPGAEVAPTDMANSLRRLHDHLARTQSVLPTVQVALRRARAVLGDDRLMAALSTDDRTMLRQVFDRTWGEVQARRYSERRLHGEPHRGNLLATPAGLRWVDLEAACVGPLEWDVASLPDEAHSAFPEVDPELLGLLRTLTSARVAAWCWKRPEIEEMRRHGEVHLERVRRAALGTGG